METFENMAVLLVTISNAKSLFTLQFSKQCTKCGYSGAELNCSFFGREFEALCGERCTSLICLIFYRHSAEGYSQFNSALELGRSCV